MIRFTRYLAVLISLFAAMTSCVDESEQLVVNSYVGGNAVTVSGRITGFDDQMVDTRSAKDMDESYTSSMAMAIFPIEGGALGECISYIHLQGSNLNFTVDRAKIRETYTEGVNYDNTPMAIYLFANVPELPATFAELTDKRFSFFMDKVYANSGIRRPQKGFPMVGSLGDTITEGADDQEFVLIPTEGSGENLKVLLPTLGGTPSDYIPIPLKSLYAKFSFAISIQPDQYIQDGVVPEFTLEKYSLHNVPSQFQATSGSNANHTQVLSDAITTSVGNTINEGGTIEFDFYLPERFLTPAISASNYDYPLGEGGALVKESSVRVEDKPYLQRFKPKLVDASQKATYITLEGYYLDHQNHRWHVYYDIYLGKDNYSNFDFERNKNYINNVVIRGLKASKDQNVTGEGVFVDHRVTITRSLPIIINLQRETLLDAHYEVRPLRLRLVGEEIPNNTNATVQILNENGTATNIPGWIRLETSGNTANHITTDGSSKGKRKYFTTDLVTNTLADGTSVTVNSLTRDNQTVWIYVDENTDTKSRAAIVRVSYADVNTDYEIVQHGLFKVTGADSGRDYYIEQYEEYLYNYDAEDSYGQTKQEGMPWGLPNVQLSHIHDSFTCAETNSDWTNYITNNPIKYDFYIGKHDDDNESSDEKTKDGGTLHNFAGQEFTKEIAENPNAGIGELTLAETANSAVEYCYNRNKRDENGNVVKVEWYLPSADELEDFIVPAYSTFEEFQNNYYWTSQPAYIRNAFYYEYYNGRQSNSNRVDTYVFVTYEDNKTHARATKVVYNNSKYDYVPSGLNRTSENATIDCYEPICKDTYFNVMYGWYRWSSGGRTETNEKTFTTDEHFNEYIDGRATGIRYHVELGHLEDLIQKTEDGETGYKRRTESHRVRCVRVAPPQ